MNPLSLLLLAPRLAAFPPRRAAPLARFAAPLALLAGLILGPGAPAHAGTTVTPIPAGTILAAPASPQFSIAVSDMTTYAGNGEPRSISYVTVHEGGTQFNLSASAPFLTSNPVRLNLPSCLLNFTDPRALAPGLHTYQVVVWQNDWVEQVAWIDDRWVDDYDWDPETGELVVVGSHWEAGHWEMVWYEGPWTFLSQQTIAFTVTGDNLLVTQSAGAPTYQPGGTVTITAVIAYTGEARALGLDVMIPSGWSYAGGSGSEGGVKPSPGATDFLEWAWLEEPASPVVFTYTLSVPAGQSGAKQILGDVVLRRGNTKEQATAIPLNLNATP